MSRFTVWEKLKKTSNLRISVGYVNRPVHSNRTVEPETGQKMVFSCCKRIKRRVNEMQNHVL